LYDNIGIGYDNVSHNRLHRGVIYR